MESLVIGALAAGWVWAEVRCWLADRRTDVRERDLLNRLAARDLPEYEAIAREHRRDDSPVRVAPLVQGPTIEELASMKPGRLSNEQVAGGQDRFRKLMGEE